MRSEEDRRDRDLLIEIHTITKSLDERTRNLNDNFTDHLRQDKEDFNSIQNKIDTKWDEAHRRINKINWYIAMGIGGLIVIEFVLNFVKK